MTSTASYAHTDAGLLDRAEQGDEAAFTALYRRHYAATRRLAYTYLVRGEPDDLVDATFAEVAEGLRTHRRPADSFGLHVFATMRRLAGQQSGDAPRGVVGEVPPAVAAVAGRHALGGTDRATITQAFASLSDRWQVVVWHTAVDRCDASELARRLGVSARAAAVQAQRAGSKLRQAYLDAHLREAPRPGCHPHRQRLAALHRKALGTADEAATREHLDRCDSCRNLVDDFDNLDERLAWAVVPLFPFVAVPGSAVAPLAVGVATHDVGTPLPAAGPLPFRSAYPGPRHMASGPTYGRDQGETPDPYADDDLPRRRPGVTAIVAAATAVVVLLAGFVVATSLPGGGGKGDDLQAANIDTESTTDSDDTVSAETVDPSADRSTEGSSATTGRQQSTTATDDGTTTSSRRSTSSSSSSSSSSSTSVSSTSSSVTAGSSTTATAPSTSPTTGSQPSPGLGLVLDAPSWRRTDDAEGLLTVAVRRQEALTVAGVPSDSDVSVTLDLTDAVRLGARLDTRCDADVGRRGTVDGTITCTLDAPASGEAETLSLDLVVDRSGQQARVSAEQDGADVGTSTTDLVVVASTTRAGPRTSTSGASTG